MEGWVGRQGTGQAEFEKAHALARELALTGQRVEWGN